LNLKSATTSDTAGADVVAERAAVGFRDCAFRDPSGILIRINELR